MVSTGQIRGVPEIPGSLIARLVTRGVLPNLPRRGFEPPRPYFPKNPRRLVRLGERRVTYARPILLVVRSLSSPSCVGSYFHYTFII